MRISILSSVYRVLGNVYNQINSVLSRRFGGSFKFAALVVGILLLVVVLFVIFRPPIIGWLAGQHNNEIPSDIIYRPPEQGYNPTLRPKLNIGKIHFSEEYLDGTDTNKLSITIRNEGPVDAGNLTIQIRLFVNPNDLKEEVTCPEITEVPIIPKGEEKTVDIYVKGSIKLSKGKAEIKGYLVDSNSIRAFPLTPFTFETRELATPKLKLKKWAVKSVEPGKDDISLYEKIKLEFEVHNDSNKEAKEVKVQVEKPKNGVLFSEEVDESANNTITSTFEKINGKDHQLISHTYFTNKNFEGSELKFTISATVQNSSEYGFSKKIIKKTINRGIKPQGDVTVGENDDESPLHEPVKSSGNTLWLIVGGGLFILFILWKRLRRAKQTTPGSTTTQSKPRDSNSGQKAAYKAATGHKESFK